MSGGIRQRKTKVIYKNDKIEELDTEESAVKFSILDIIRMVSGILVLIFSTSFYFTGGFTFGYNGKLIDPHYLYFQTFGSYVNLTDAELTQFDGSIEGTPIYIAVNGTVFDVSSARGIYGPKGSYSYLSGKDCARAYATNCLNQQTYDIRDLEPEERRRLRGWYEFFEAKYFKVGVVNHEPLTGPTPDRNDCRGRGQ